MVFNTFINEYGIASNLLNIKATYSPPKQLKELITI